MAKGLVEVGVALVLKDEFSKNAGLINQSMITMMNGMNQWTRGINSEVGVMAEYGREMVSGMMDAYKHSAAINSELFLTSKIAGATAQERIELTKLAQEVNNMTPLTNTDIASGMRYLAMAGNTATQIESMIAPASQLASIFQMSLGGKGGVADLMTNIMATFGIASSDAEHVADVLGVATTSANINLTDLAQSLQYSGAVFRNAGVDLATASAAIGVLGDQGIQASSAGTALANMLRYFTLSLTGQREKGAKMLEALGLTPDQFKTASGELKSLTDIVALLGEATRGLTGPSRMQAFYNIFGVRGERAISALLQDYYSGRNKLSQILGNISGGEGWTNETMTQYMGEAQGQINRLTAAWDNFRMTFGKAISPIITPLISGLATVTNFISKINDTLIGRGFARLLLVSTSIGLFRNGLLLISRTLTAIGATTRFLTGGMRNQGIMMQSINTAAQNRVHLTGVYNNQVRTSNNLLALELSKLKSIAAQQATLNTLKKAMVAGDKIVLANGMMMAMGRDGRVNYFGRKASYFGMKVGGRPFMSESQFMWYAAHPNAGTRIKNMTHSAAVTARYAQIYGRRAMLGHMGRGLARVGGTALSFLGGPWGLAIGGIMMFLPEILDAIKGNTDAQNENTGALNKREHDMSPEEYMAYTAKQLAIAVQEMANQKDSNPTDMNLNLSLNGRPIGSFSNGGTVPIDDVNYYPNYSFED